MRDIKIVEQELNEAKRSLEKIDESNLLKLEVAKSKIERLENELEKIKRGPRKISVVEGLPKGKYKINSKRTKRIIDNNLKI